MIFQTKKVCKNCNRQMQKHGRYLVRPTHRRLSYNTAEIVTFVSIKQCRAPICYLTCVNEYIQSNASYKLHIDNSNV